MRASRRPRLGRPAVAGTETAHRTFTTPGHSLPIFRELTATQRPAQRHVRDGEPPSMHARAPRSRTSWRQARIARAQRPPRRRELSPLGHAGDVGSDESSWQHEAADCPQRFSAQINSSSIVKTPQLWHFSSSSRHSSVEDYSTVWSGNRRVAAEPAASVGGCVSSDLATKTIAGCSKPSWRAINWGLSLVSVNRESSVSTVTRAAHPAHMVRSASTAAWPRAAITRSSTIILADCYTLGSCASRSSCAHDGRLHD